MTTELQYLLYGARSLIKTAGIDLHNPIHTGAIGAGVGGLGGLVGSVLSSGDPEKKSKLRAVLLGALGGGGIGAAAGALNPKPQPEHVLDPAVEVAKSLWDNGSSALANKLPSEEAANQAFDKYVPNFLKPPALRTE